jgi:hypothetical protein
MQSGGHSKLRVCFARGYLAMLKPFWDKERRGVGRLLMCAGTHFTCYFVMGRAESESHWSARYARPINVLA